MSRRDCMNVKVDTDLVRKAKVVAAAKHIALTDYVSGLLRPLIEEDLAQVATGLPAMASEARALNGSHQHNSEWREGPRPL
jgi:hypothetical protein